MSKTDRSRWILGISITLIALDMLLLVSTLQLTGDHYSYRGAIVYPLFLHFASPLFPLLETFIALLGAVGLIVANRASSVNKRVRPFYLVLAIISACIILWGLTLSVLGRVPQPIHLSSLQFNDYVYDLIADPCYKMDSLCPPTSYIVLRCDSLGLVCHFWAVLWSEKEYGKVTSGSALIIDLSNHILYAEIGGQRIQVADENTH